MLKAFSNITLAFLIFISSTGFWIEGHYCQEQNEKISLFSFFGSCCDDEDQSSCSHDSQKEADHSEHGDCCKLSFSFHKSDLKPSVLSQDLSTSYELFAVPPSCLPIVNSTIPRGHDLPLRIYVPPPILTDYQAQFQVFIC